MASQDEGRYTGEFILAEAPGAISRTTGSVDVPAATTLEPGTVLGQLSATGHYAPYDDSLSDGSETAVAILYGQAVNATDAPVAVECVVIDAIAEVRADDLIWGDGVDDAAGLVDLAARYIKARD